MQQCAAQSPVHLCCSADAHLSVQKPLLVVLTPRTLLSGELGYNKAVHTSHGLPGINNIEPELILTQAIARRAGAYLDCDTYYDFNAGDYAQTLKVGLEFELDRKERWGLSPYFQFPLNHFTRMTDIANSAGVELGYYS